METNLRERILLCLANAAECEKAATCAATPDLRQHYFELARHWCDAADEVINALEESRPN
jgi:hypothetical protein